VTSSIATPLFVRSLRLLLCASSRRLLGLRCLRRLRQRLKALASVLLLSKTRSRKSTLPLASSTIGTRRIPMRRRLTLVMASKHPPSSRGKLQTASANRPPKNQSPVNTFF
jgi:hypothetical protein